MNEIYWITRLDALHVFFVIILLLLATALILDICWFVINVDEEKDIIKKAKTWTKIISISLVAFILAVIFVPTTSEALLIYGVGGAVDYIKSDKVAKRLPDKCIKALDKYLDKQNSKQTNHSK